MQYYLNDKKLNKIEKQKAEKDGLKIFEELDDYACLLYTSPSPRDATLSRMPSSA